MPHSLSVFGGISKICRNGRFTINQDVTVFLNDNLYVVSNNPIDDYFAFRAVYISLMEALEVSPRGAERLYLWYRDRKDAKPTSDVVMVEDTTLVDTDEEELLVEEDHESISHSQIQLMLAKNRQKVGVSGLDCQ